MLLETHHVLKLKVHGINNVCHSTEVKVRNTNQSQRSSATLRKDL